MAAWFKGDPPEAGYYLAAWKLTDRLVVSELWFNPDSIGGWWFDRGYAPHPRVSGLDAQAKGVVAWMPLPDPPSLDSWEA